MKAILENSNDSGISAVYVEHRGQRLEFNAAVYQQAFKKGSYDPFLQINNYWDRQETEFKDKLFELFLETKNIFNNIYQVNDLILQLRPVVAQMLDMHDNEELERWTRFHGRVWIPEDLDVEYKDDVVRPGSREQTYLVSDYWELVFMVMKLRVIAPIWGEFVEVTKKESGPIFRDLNTYYLISKTHIEKSPAMQRLNRYVAKNVKQDDIDIRSSINGIGSDSFQANLIANILVRFLVIASLTREPSDTHLVQIVHKTLRNRLSQNESHQNAILEKLNPGEDDLSEDSSSRAEKYKNKPLVPPGEFTAIEKSTEYTHEIAARILTVNELTAEQSKALDVALADAQSMGSTAFEECQIHLMQWAISPIITARALWDINRSSILRLAGITQFYLWQIGYKDLAGLVTARSLTAEGVMQYSSESRAHIPKDLIDQLNELYPFYRRHPTKKALKPNNEAINEIMQLSQDLSDHTWFLNMADHQIAELKGSAANKTHRVGYDIRIRLSELAIFLQKRNEEFISLYSF